LDEETSVSAEEKMVLARRLMEARVEGDLDALDEMLSPDFTAFCGSKLNFGESQP
jgi:hypothetical protein